MVMEAVAVVKIKRSILTMNPQVCQDIFVVSILVHAIMPYSR